MEPVDLGIIPDDPDVLREALTRAAEADVVVSTGGVSMGDYDVTKMVLQGDAHVDFWQVAIQPAKPFAFGHIGDALFFGLPGNPVSVLVSFEQFARPSLLKMQGARRSSSGPSWWPLPGKPSRPIRRRQSSSASSSKDLEAGSPTVVKSGGQASNVLSAAAAADGFAVVPRGTAVDRAWRPGDRRDVQVARVEGVDRWAMSVS